MREITARFILWAPVLILAVDGLVWHFFGREATITGVVQDWAEKSTCPEFVYVVGCAILYFHLFKGWPD